jgi:hypothetical protein
MIASFAIIGLSSLLFLYWFRYTCVLILGARTTQDYASQVARANELSFPGVQAKLQEPGAELEPLERALARDYRFLTYCLRHAAELNLGSEALESRMLMIDYRVMKIWYSLTRRMFPNQARSAVEEMSEIVGHFANTMGERLASTTTRV